MFLKRQAIQIVAQLPDDREHALAVLDYARDLYAGFLKPEMVEADHLVSADEMNRPIGDRRLALVKKNTA